jgi:hypothetical protein
MQHGTQVPAHQQLVLGNTNAEIDKITKSWSSTEVAATIHAQHIWNSRQREYRCADIRRHVDGNGLNVQLTALTTELCMKWQHSMGLIDENEDLLPEWNSLYGGMSYESDDNSVLLSVARPEELIWSPKFFYELNQALILLAKCKREKLRLRTYGTERRCILAFKPLIDEWRVRHPRLPSAHPMPIPVLHHLNIMELRQCIVNLCDFLQSLTITQVLRIAHLCSQLAMDIMEFQPIDVDETLRHQYFLPRQHLQNRLTLDIRTVVTPPHTTNIQHLCRTWEERGSEGKCSDMLCICCSCDSDLFRISESLTILALRHEMGKDQESNDLLKKDEHGVFYMNFYMQAYVDMQIRSTILEAEIDQQTQENTSIQEMFMRQPRNNVHESVDIVLYACDSQYNGHIPAADTT